MASDVIKNTICPDRQPRKGNNGISFEENSIRQDCKYGTEHFKPNIGKLVKFSELHCSLSPQVHLSCLALTEVWPKGNLLLSSMAYFST